MTREQFNSTPLADLLTQAGYGHRAIEGAHDGRRQVFRLSDGEIVGRMNCFECAEWLMPQMTAECDTLKNSPYLDKPLRSEKEVLVERGESES